MSNTPSQLNVDNLPADVRQALRDTFGDEFTPGMSMDQLFANSEDVVAPTGTSKEEAEVPSTPSPDIAMANSINDVVIDLDNMPSELTAEQPIVPVNAAPSLRAEEEEIVPIEALVGKKRTTSKKGTTGQTIATSIAVNTAQLITKLEAKLVSESTIRFSDASWYENVNKSRIAIIGAGGIGSWAALLLSKFSVPITLYDGDRFELVNQAGQIFLMRDMTSSKSNAISNLCFAVNGTSVIQAAGNWTDNYGLEKITIAAVDNMRVRKEAFKRWLASYKGASDALFIDARLAAEMFQIYTVRGNDKLAQERYLREWFSDDEADNTPCSYKQTAYMAAMLGGRIVNQYVNFLSSADKEMIPRIVPFFIEYEAYGYEKIINYA